MILSENRFTLCANAALRVRIMSYRPIAQTAAIAMTIATN
jgi:hypothetical protein